MKYQIIYADPPWQYDFSQSDSRAIESNYPTMSTEEICSLKVPSEENCILYLWATAPKLLDALQVIRSWGFEYKTHAVWDKETQGMGYWFRGQHELLLVATRGNVHPPPKEFRVGSVFRSRRSEHSKKPYLITELISQWYPSCTKIELFSRDHYPLLAKLAD